jgi:pterin-4a-carbinolamine dehydratase
MRRPPLTPPGWRRIDQALVRELSFRDFDMALEFVERVAACAVDHLRRPDICILSFNRVRLTIANQRHAGLTAAELRMLAKVDALIEHGTAIEPPPQPVELRLTAPAFPERAHRHEVHRPGRPVAG